VRVKLCDVGTGTTYNVVANSSTVTQSVLHATGGSSIVNTTTLDGFGRAQQTSLADSAGDDLMQYTYDGNGNRSALTNPYRTTWDMTYGTTNYVYDVLGRLTSTVLPDTSNPTATYFANTVVSTDASPAHRQRKLVSDGLGRISQALEPDSTGAFNYVTQYSYLQNYNGSNYTYQTIVQQKGGTTNSALWRTRTFTHDMMGRVIQENIPETGQNPVTFAYPFGTGSNCAGSLSLLCGRVDARGVGTAYSYDALNRITGKTYGATSPTTPNVSYFYDQSSYNGLSIANGKGLRTGMSDGSGQTAWSFDSMGRVATIEKTINGSTKTAGYIYNADGSVASTTVYSGDVVSYAYNNAGMPVSVIESTAVNFATGATYAAPGMMTGLVQGNASGFAGITTSNVYNKMLQPAVLSSTTPSATVLSLSYGFGAAGNSNGNVQQIVNNMDNTRSQSFAYDQLNRVQSAQAGTSWGDTYVYDPWGNLLQKNPISGVGTAENLVIAVNPTNQVIGLGYDAAGNVTSDNLGNNWTYDAEGRVSTVAGYTYIYDGDGNRVIKSGTNARMYWTDPGGTVLSETDLSGSNTVRDVYLGNKLIARKDASGSIHYLVQDQLGSERVSVSASGTVEDHMDTYPWGGHAANYTAASGNPYTFTGDEEDSESTSFHTPFRQLSSTLGRWLGPDPYDGSYDATNPQSLNRYTYVQNDPLNFTDPLGLETFRVCTGTPKDTDGHCVAPKTPPPAGCIYVENAEQSMWTGEQCSSVLDFRFFPSLVSPSGSNSGSSSGPAPNNGPQKPTLVKKALKFYCKDSPSTRVLTSVRNGAAIGAVRGAFTGFVSGEIFGGEVTLGLSGVAGAGLGAFIQGTIGATTGVIKGFASAEACQAAGAYAPGS
jgi:RHS repeat-associated protein